MKFPKHIKHRGKTLAKIYRGKAHPYRVAWVTGGKRRMKAFSRFGGDDGALPFAEKLVRELSRGSQSTALTPAQATDALAALERLQGFYASTGKRVSLLMVASEYVEAAGKLNGHSMREAVEGYVGTVASVRRKDIAEAVEEFLQTQEPRTKAKPGERTQISAQYLYIVGLRLRRFAAAFPNTVVCDVSKEHVDLFFRSKHLSAFTSKTRNHFRAAIRQFAAWAARKDYIAANHRLFESDSLRPEHANTAEVGFYTPTEFRKLLEGAEGELKAVLAIGGLAGLRTAELLRLDWADVWRAAGHIEVSKGKSKTRQRRLIEIVPALEQWLEPFRQSQGKVWLGDAEVSPHRNECLLHAQLNTLCEAVGVARKKNGLRHSFCSFHFALHSNENLTAAQAGNSPAMIHSNYKGLATKAEAEQWFETQPSKKTVQ